MHDQQFEALADSLVRRMWQSVILPGVGLQCALFLGFAWTLSGSSLLAHDDEPPVPSTVIIARFPEVGQPPAPADEKPAVEKPAEVPTAEQPAIADAPAVVDQATNKVAEAAAPKSDDKPRDDQPGANKPSPAAEVASDAQVAQLADKPAEPPSEVRELSVEPVLETRPKLPADRPAWVGASNDTSERVHRLYVASFTADNREAVEGDEMLDEPMVAAVRRYLDETVFPGEGALKLPITAEFVRQNLLDKSTSYVAAMTTQSGTEYQKWVVLQVTPDQRAYLGGQLREHKQRERMATLGVVLVSVLIMTGLANVLLVRRRRRYPDSLTPITMAIMPGNGPAGQTKPQGASPGSDGNAVHYVAAAPRMVCKAPRKTRSLVCRTLIMVGAVVAVFVFILPMMVVKIRRHEAQRTEVRRVEVDGRVWEVKTTRPLMEHVSNDHD